MKIHGERVKSRRCPPSPECAGNFSTCCQHVWLGQFPAIQKMSRPNFRGIFQSSRLKTAVQRGRSHLWVQRFSLSSQTPSKCPTADPHSCALRLCTSSPCSCPDLSPHKRSPSGFSWPWLQLNPLEVRLTRRWMPCHVHHTEPSLVKIYTILSQRASRALDAAAKGCPHNAAFPTDLNVGDRLSAFRCGWSFLWSQHQLYTWVAAVMDDAYFTRSVQPLHELPPWTCSNQELKSIPGTPKNRSLWPNSDVWCKYLFIFHFYFKGC